MRSTISLGNNICRLRKEARLTQDDLASHLSVTKAAVSKWETGQSNPDIELLSRIAAYFSVTIDDLVGYEPQMDKEDIARECARLRAAFASESFEKAHRQCQELVRDYYACYPLLAQLAILYLNHWDLAGESERKGLADEAIDLCHRVRHNSESSIDIKLAEAVEASFLLGTGNPQGAIDVLGEMPEVETGRDIILAGAYGAVGRVDDADMVLQGSLLQSLVLSLNSLAQLAMLYASNPTKLAIAHERSLAIIKAFDMERLYVNTAAVHLSFAMAFATGGDAQRCLDCLEDYERACRLLEFPIKLHGDDFFNNVVPWLEIVNTMGTSAPRDEDIVRRSLLESVTLNPAFLALADEPRYKMVVKNLEEVVR